jgi:hypothetical protein
MDGYIWRIPTVFGVMACFALVLFAAGVLASMIGRRHPSTTTKRTIAAVLVVLAIGVVVAVRWAASVVARSLEISVTHVDPGFAGYLTPMIFAAFAFAVGNWTLRGTWTGRQALLFYIWLLVFTSANVINRCSPGWCMTMGFPFVWNYWSDVILTFDGDYIVKWIAAIFRAIAAVLNLLIFGAIAGLLLGTQPLKRAS